MTKTRPAERDEDDTAGPEGRRCIVTGESQKREKLIRFVVSPEGEVVADISGKLPGRGLWLTARREVLEEAMRKRAFSRAAKGQVRVREDMAAAVEAGLLRSATSLIGLARRAGVAVAGQAKVEDALRRRKAVLLLEASDGAADGRAKMRRLAADVAVRAVLTRTELGTAFDREQSVHAAILAAADGTAAIADRLVGELDRLAGFRAESAGLGLENGREGCIEPLAR